MLNMLIIGEKILLIIKFDHFIRINFLLYLFMCPNKTGFEGTYFNILFGKLGKPKFSMLILLKIN